LAGSDRRPLARTLALTVAIAAVLALAGAVLLWPRYERMPDLSQFGFAADVVTADVVELAEGSCSFAQDLSCRRVTFQILQGPDAGTITVEEWELIPSSPVFEVGDGVLLNVVPEAPALERYQFADRERRPLLAVVAALFLVAVVVLARWRGVAALGALVISLWIVLGFIVPAILTGRPPELVAATGGSLIALAALYLTHGWRPLTHVATIGTFAALALTVLISAAVTRLADLSGFVSEEASFILLLETVDLRGLLLAGMVLGALGALDDVTVTQASAVWEISQANPGLDRGRLVAAGLRVGRDHVAASVNTLLLAYAGAALPLLLLFALSGLSLSVVANSEVVAVEIIRTLVGSMGLVSAVPITTWLAAMVASAKPT
jgi:uncharacterized membrane protein